jgi:plasmid stabilization system protein ParE
MYLVKWTKRALDRLADLYVSDAPDERERMAAAVEALNSRLQSNPLEQGESRAGGFRITFVELLVVGFHVDVIARKVLVNSVRRYGA